MSTAPSETVARSTPTCCVVVCTRERPALLDRCLEAVVRLTYPRYEIVVVDNAPRDAQAREVARRHGARYVVEPAPGLSRARNRGASTTEAEIVAYLDDDALPEPDWLDAITPEFEDPWVMAVTGRILAAGDTAESDRVRELRDSFDCGTERRVVDRDVPRWFELANFGGVGDGGNMAVRRQAFDVWPGFHNQLGRGARVPGGEEHHAFFSLIDRGYRVVYAPGAVVHHPYPSTIQGFRSRLLQDRTASVAYITLLLVEEPRYRRAVVRYVAEWLGGRRRPWRAHPVPPGPRLVSHWRMVLAALAGPMLYARSRIGTAVAGGRPGARTEPAPAGVLDSAP